MDFKAYLKISLINLTFLFIGMLIGPITAHSGDSVVHAQTTPSPKQEKAAEKSTEKSPEDASVDYVSPSVRMGGPMVTNTFLASRIACDNLQVNSYDMLKLQGALLTLLERKNVISPSEAQTVIAEGRADRPLRIRP